MNEIPSIFFMMKNKYFFSYVCAASKISAASKMSAIVKNSATNKTSLQDEQDQG